MRIVAGVDELRVHSHLTAGALNTSFYHIGDTEFVCDLTKVTLTNDLVLHHRSTADYFQVRDPRQIRQNLVLHAVGEKRVLGVAASVFKRQNSDRFWRHGSFG